MSLNTTPSSDRIHIGFFGRRNAGKSSLINAITRQPVSIVSDTAGTTTDPVYRAMEILPLGPVMMIDTPGFDDVGELGELRVRRTKQVLNKTDIAVLVIDAVRGWCECDRGLQQLFSEKQIPYVVVYNRCDLAPNLPKEDGVIFVSAKTGDGIEQVKERLQSFADAAPQKRLCADLLHPGDLVVLVVPVDSAAPKGRLILPQQQTLRDVLDADATAVVCKETDFAATLRRLQEKPALVITDSQVFHQVSAQTPDDVLLTSFSILMARYKGFLEQAVYSAAQIKCLQDGDRVLIAEGCTHHRQCEDIGTVKLPAWLRRFTGKDLHLDWVSGTDFPEDVTPYRLIIHCGGCMLPEREVRYRAKCAADQAVPMTNYGIAIAYMNGILQRSLQIFPTLTDFDRGNC